MSILVDTNVLVRFFDQKSVDHATCVGVLCPRLAIKLSLVVCTQVHIEFWSVATRPANVNGLDMLPDEANAALQNFENFLPTLKEPVDIAARWRKLVIWHQVRGRPSHDARLVALMDAYGINQLLTINPGDFRRYSHIRLYAPQELLAQA